jgi:16S rRNA (guanine966-N2)-methyltransferase
VFNILTSMDVIEEAPVVDLFAGSGALGIEALSRGAASATFVERDRAARDCIAANLAVLGEDAGRGRIVSADALGYLRRLPVDARPGVVFADPPYSWSSWADLLDPLAALADLVVAESAGPWAPGPAWETVTVRRYGSTVVSILRPRATLGRAESGLLAVPAHHQPRGGT